MLRYSKIRCFLSVFYRSLYLQTKSAQVWTFKSDLMGPATKVTLNTKAVDVPIEEDWADLDAIRALLEPTNPEGSLKTALEKMLASCQELATMESKNKVRYYFTTVNFVN